MFTAVLIDGIQSSKLSEYRVWAAMKDRCQRPNNKQYHNYGGRGIVVCERWSKSFVDFITDMGRRPSNKHSIDRIDNNKGYEPGNCRWATRKEQALNTTANRLLTLNGKTQAMSEWSKELGIHISTISSRLSNGENDEQALRQVAKDKSKILLTHNGKTQEILPWSKELGIRRQTIYARLYAGASHSEALRPTVHTGEEYE